MITLKLLEERERTFMGLIDLQRKSIFERNKILNDMWDMVKLLQDCKRLLNEGKPVPEKWFLKKLEDIEASIRRQRNFF